MQEQKTRQLDASYRKMLITWAALFASLAIYLCIGAVYAEDGNGAASQT
jgi:hypothetical protein